MGTIVIDNAVKQWRPRIRSCAAVNILNNIFLAA